ncbi:MAG: aminotransferase class I/II-fold pyridoxal phosphate-dependent enzyme [Acidilobus sp.]
MRPEDVIGRLKEIARSIPFHGRDAVLGSMTTPPNPVAKEAFEMFQFINANDLEMYRPIRELELDVIRELGGYLGCGDRCSGYVTTGGSEANLAALYLAREHGLRAVYYAATVHHSIIKAARLLGMKTVEVGMRGFRMDPSALITACRSEGAGVVVATVGTTGVGSIDPVEELSETAASCGSVVHVDAAYGGLVAPFLYANRRLGFQSEVVMSVTVDPHKLGQAPIPSGGLIARDEDWFSPLEFEASYMPAGKQIGLLGTRSAGSVAAAWAALKVLGPEGLKEQASRLMSLARNLASAVESVGASIAHEPEVPIVCVRSDSDDALMRWLWERGLYVYKCGVVKGVRAVMMPHVTDKVVSSLIGALRAAPDGLLKLHRQ